MIKPFRVFELPDLPEIQRTVLAFIEARPRIYRRETKRNLNLLDHAALLAVCPQLETVLGLRTVESYAYVMYDQASSGIHIDPAELHHARLNIPILNCAGSTTHFYRGDVPRVVTNDAGISVTCFHPSECVEIAVVEIVQPTLLHVQCPHKVIIPEGHPVPRITLSLEFEVDPIFLLEEPE